MAFKSGTKEAPPATRNRTRDSAMVREVEKLVKGAIPSIECTGDDTKSTTVPKGRKQSPREESIRKETSAAANYIRNTLNLAARTVVNLAAAPMGDPWTGYVALVKDDNGNVLPNVKDQNGAS